MISSRASARWKVTVVATAAVGLLLATLLISPGATTGSRRSSGGIGIQRALAGDLNRGGGLTGNYVLGLFSESVGGNMKAKIPRSEWSGIRNIRLFVKWKAIERDRRGAFAWSVLDSQVNNALSVGVNSIMMTLDGPVPAGGRRELLTVVREQLVSRVRHRYGYVAD